MNVVSKFFFKKKLWKLSIEDMTLSLHFSREKKDYDINIDEF